MLENVTTIYTVPRHVGKNVEVPLGTCVTYYDPALHGEMVNSPVHLSDVRQLLEPLIAGWIEVAEKSSHSAEYREGYQDCANELQDYLDSFVRENTCHA